MTNNIANWKVAYTREMTEQTINLRWISMQHVKYLDRIQMKPPPPHTFIPSSP